MGDDTILGEVTHFPGSGRVFVIITGESLFVTRETVHTPHDVGKGFELFPVETKLPVSAMQLLEGSDDEVLSFCEGTPLPDSGATLFDLRKGDYARTDVRASHIAHLPDPFVLVDFF